jgi:hypothetical protein
MTVIATERVSSTVPLYWNEVYGTNCPLASCNSGFAVGDRRDRGLG